MNWNKHYSLGTALRVWVVCAVVGGLLGYALTHNAPAVSYPMRADDNYWRTLYFYHTVANPPR